MKKYLSIILLLALAGCKSKPVSPFKILKVFKNDGKPVVNVQIKSRLNAEQLLGIAASIRKDSTKYDSFKIDYLLEGAIDKYPDVSDVYAIAEYPIAGSSATDTKDAEGNAVLLNIFGMDVQKAKHLLSLNPSEATGKTIVGKFVDDYTKTISIVYLDSKEPGQTFILELDTAGKVVSATAPLKVMHNGVEKLVVSDNGDYCTLKDSILTMYSSDDLEHPFRSVKAGL